MKKIVLVVFVLLTSFFTYAQTNNNNYIEVTGEAIYEKTVENYIVEIILAEDLCYGYNNDNTSLSELKDDFFRKLEKQGISKDKLTEDKLEYLASSYRKDGTFYKFFTTNKDDFLKILTIKSNGLQFRGKKITYKELSVSESTALKQKAINDARKKADEYATIMKTKINNIQYVKDYNYTKIAEDNIYYASQQNTYRVTVTFSFK